VCLQKSSGANKRNPLEVRVTEVVKTLNQDCLHPIGKFCAAVSNILSKEIISNNTKYRNCETDTDDEILPVFAQFL